MIDWVASHLFLATGALALAASSIAVTHALLYKEEVRAAIAWVRLILLVPLFGSILYFLIGVNRIRRRAVALRRETERTTRPHAPSGGTTRLRSPRGLVVTRKRRSLHIWGGVT
jgi:cardiolipin synthase